LRSNGYPYEDLREASVAKALSLRREIWGGDHPAITVLECRQWAARTSIRKAGKALQCVGPGDRARYQFQFGGASRTLRWAGRLIQPQNLVRTPKMLEEIERLDLATDLIRRGDYDAISLYVTEPMEVFTGTMRGMFRAPAGHTFQVCDYSSVESAGLGWVARCERLLEVFRQGRDPYLDFGTLFYNKPYEQITRAERQVCKAPCLACGYGMGPGRIEDGVKTGLLKYAEGMGVELTLEQARHAVDVYRTGYAEVVTFWHNCMDAARLAVIEGVTTEVGYIRFEWNRPYLLIRLPSGRHIYYYKPWFEKKTVETGRSKWSVVNGRTVEIPEVQTRVVFTCMGRNQRTTKWDRIEVRASHFAENVTQALCRDVLKVGMQRLHDDGFDIVGHSHDEVITVARVGDNYHTWERMREIMREPIDWAPGFPLNAAGYAGSYYRK
jgi:DNA polymerase